jgi:hypothetical protein
MRSWPERPAAGEPVRLPLALPPVLCEAAGYTRSARYVALYWTPFGDGLMYTDGELTATGSWPAWSTLCAHQLGRALLAPYRLGSSESDAEQWLLANRWQHTLDVGLALDVRQLLATQPSELAAATEILGAERTRTLIEEQLRHPRIPDVQEIQARLERSRTLVEELARWGFE